MRGWIRGNWRHLMVGLLCTAIVISSTALYLTYRQPEVCSLCGSGKRERYQAPVILNLTTGQSNEMRIYDPDLPSSEYEIAPIQTTGTFSFASCAGYTGRRDTCSHTCTVDLPIETKGLKVSHFCLDCRVLLKDHAENGFLTTGQSNEMRIYDPDLPSSEYEIAPIQTTGTFSFASCAGYTGRRDTCSHTCTVDLPIETKGLKVSHFCLDCRVLLKDHAENGFVLADLYVEDAIDIYPATVGADYTIRDYRITVSEAKVRSEMELIVLGIAEGLTFVD